MAVLAESTGLPIVCGLHDGSVNSLSVPERKLTVSAESTGLPIVCLFQKYKMTVLEELTFLPTTCRSQKEN